MTSKKSELGEFFIKAGISLEKPVVVSKLTCDYEGDEIKAVVNDMSKDLTEQQWKESCDINNIIKNYVACGVSPYVDVFQDASKFMDVSDVPDMQTSFNRMQQAMDAFVQNVPAAIREKFANDPYQFYQFVNNRKNIDVVKQMFGDSKNYSVPTADAVEEAQRDVVLNSGDKKE